MDKYTCSCGESALLTPREILACKTFRVLEQITKYVDKDCLQPVEKSIWIFKRLLTKESRQSCCKKECTGKIIGYKDEEKKILGKYLEVRFTGLTTHINYTCIRKSSELKMLGCGQSSNLLVIFLLFPRCSCMSCRVKGRRFQRSSVQQINTSQTSVESLEKHLPMFLGRIEQHWNCGEILL